MTAFKTIKGVPVKTISGDRAGASFEGQLYYDSDGVGIFKFVGALAAGAWASGGALNDSREALGSAGTQTASLAFGGSSPTESNITIIISYRHLIAPLRCLFLLTSAISSLSRRKCIPFCFWKESSLILYPNIDFLLIIFFSCLLNSVKLLLLPAFW